MRRQLNVARALSFVAIALSALASPALAQKCPQMAGFHLTAASACSVAVSGDHACVADDIAGVWATAVTIATEPVDVGPAARQAWPKMLLWPPHTSTRRTAGARLS